MLPLWSIWACVRIITSALTASGGGRRFFSRDASRRPWNIPQSMRMVPLGPSTRCIEPVTCRAAPRNLILMGKAYLDSRRCGTYVAGTMTKTKGGPEGPVEIPEIISILPLRNSVLFPGSIIPIDVGRSQRLRMVEVAISMDKLVCGFSYVKVTRTEEHEYW